MMEESRPAGGRRRLDTSADGGRRDHSGHRLPFAGLRAAGDAGPGYICKVKVLCTALYYCIGCTIAIDGVAGMHRQTN